VTAHNENNEIIPCLTIIWPWKDHLARYSVMREKRRQKKVERSGDRKCQWCSYDP